MSLFSDISGYNSQTLKNLYGDKNDSKYDFSEVDFCIKDGEESVYSEKASSYKEDESIFGFGNYDTDSLDFQG